MGKPILCRQCEKSITVTETQYDRHLWRYTCDGKDRGLYYKNDFWRLYHDNCPDYVPIDKQMSFEDMEEENETEQ